MDIAPAKLKEMAGRIVRTKMKTLPLNQMLPRYVVFLYCHHTVLSREVLQYLSSANQCVNPKCKGVYFEACVEHIKFVDFCGKYRVPLLQFLWWVHVFSLKWKVLFSSPKCSASTPAYTGESSSESEDDSQVPNNQMMLKKVLLG